VCVDKAYVVLMPTRELESLLPADKFVRIQRSYIINLGKIESTTYDAVTINRVTLPIGRTYKKYFAEFLKRINQ
jgi:DNA-binding LytR/AlgR family response regulator